MKFLLVLVLALVVFLGARLAVPFLFRGEPAPRGAAPPGQGKSDHGSQARRGPAKTNDPSRPPEGFYVGNGGQRVYVDYATPDPVLRSFLHSVMTDGPDPNAKGREIFMKICAACHQRDGEGKDGLAPPLAGSEWVLAPGGGRLTRIVLNGFAGPVRVRGREWNLSMPPWRGNLDDDQVAVVLTYLRTQVGTNHAGPITPEMVAEARQETHPTLETAEELLRIPDH